MTRLLTILAITVFLAACASQPPAPVEDRSERDRARMEQARAPAPASAEQEGLQVYALRNPAVTELSDAARQAEAGGDLDRAAMLLERALRIEGRDPELLQYMAEIKLGQGDYEQAASYAGRSFDVGPRLGEICQRNWRTVATARDALGESDDAARARQREGQCRVERPQRF